MRNTSKHSIPLLMGLATFVCFIIYFAVDYFNIPSLLGMKLSRLNTGLLSIASGSIIALLVFALTYYLVDQRNIKRQRNQRSIALLLLRQTYEDCKKQVAWLVDLETLMALVKKTDFNASYNPNSPVGKYSEMPFKNESVILQFAADGLLSSSELKEYFKIKNMYQQHVNLSVVFFDHLEKVSPNTKTIINEIETALSKIVDTVE